MSELEESTAPSPPSPPNAPLEETPPVKKLKLIIRAGKPLPYPEDDYEPVGEIEYRSPPPLETFFINVRYVMGEEGKPLPYPLDD